MADGILERIVAAVRERLEETPPRADLEIAAAEAAAERRREGPRSLAAALSAPGPSVIAECKRASPSRGLLRDPFDPVALATAYEAAGAAAISVVTEQEFFRGDPSWIRRVRRAVRLPVLRKDFIVTRRQVLESALLGADAILLIQRILDPPALEELLLTARELGLEVLLEVFADEDPAPAVASGARILGVNARDLTTFRTDLAAVEAMARRLPDDRIRVAESGIHDAAALRRLARAGYDAFLVGEHLVTAPDPGRALAALTGRPAPRTDGGTPPTSDGAPDRDGT